MGRVICEVEARYIRFLDWIQSADEILGSYPRCNKGLSIATQATFKKPGVLRRLDIPPFSLWGSEQTGSIKALCCPRVPLDSLLHFQQPIDLPSSASNAVWCLRETYQLNIDQRPPPASYSGRVVALSTLYEALGKPPTPYQTPRPANNRQNHNFKAKMRMDFFCD